MAFAVQTSEKYLSPIAVDLFLFLVIFISLLGFNSYSILSYFLFELASGFKVTRNSNSDNWHVLSF